MKIGFVGLGKMGIQIVDMLISGGHEVVATDINSDAVKLAIDKGAVGASSREELVSKLDKPSIIWLMIPDKFVEEEVNAFGDLLDSDSILIDGGNSFFEDTIRRAEKLAKKNIHFVDVGTSGGILGLKNGFSMMVGGSVNSVNVIEPLLTTLSEPNGSFKYIGPSGYGHYVKMVHNGVEYGMMEAYAEGFDLIKNGPLENIDLTPVAEVWQHGSIVSSTLNSLILEILQSNPELNGVDGYVADSGEGRWAVEISKKAGISVPALESALQVRTASQTGETSFATKLLAAMRTKFGGHPTNKKMG